MGPSWEHCPNGLKPALKICSEYITHGLMAFINAFYSSEYVNNNYLLAAYSAVSNA